MEARRMGKGQRSSDLGSQGIVGLSNCSVLQVDRTGWVAVRWWIPQRTGPPPSWLLQSCLLPHQRCNCQDPSKPLLPGIAASFLFLINLIIFKCIYLFMFCCDGLVRLGLSQELQTVLFNFQDKSWTSSGDYRAPIPGDRGHDPSSGTQDGA